MTPGVESAADEDRAAKGYAGYDDEVGGELEDVGLGGAELDDLLWRPVEVVEAAEVGGGVGEGQVFLD